MARTPSTMIELGTPCPDFALPDTEGHTVRRDDFAHAPALLVMTICNHCPFVVHVREGLAAFAREYMARGLAIVAINANDAQAYPADAPEHMKTEHASAGYVFPYLYDETQAVARALGAACTPDFFLYGPDRTLVYRGQLDDSRPGNGKPVTGRDLRAACDAVLSGGQPSAEQWPSLGCNIKWKPGNDPLTNLFA
jgi:peroxiredoxin